MRGIQALWGILEISENPWYFEEFVGKPLWFSKTRSPFLIIFFQSLQCPQAFPCSKTGSKTSVLERINLWPCSKRIFKSYCFSMFSRSKSPNHSHRSSISYFFGLGTVAIGPWRNEIFWCYPTTFFLTFSVLPGLYCDGTRSNDDLDHAISSNRLKTSNCVTPNPKLWLTPANSNRLRCPVHVQEECFES